MLKDIIAKNNELRYDCKNVHMYPIGEEEVP